MAQGPDHALGSLTLLFLVVATTQTNASDLCSEVANVASAVNRFQAAQASARDGDYDCSRRMYARLMFDEPDNVDYIFGYAQVLHWSGQDTEALQYLSMARSLAPDYEDIWRLEADVRASLRDVASGSDEFLRAASLRFPDAAWMPSKSDLRYSRHRWSVSIGRDHLSTDVPDWQQTGADVRWQVGPRLRMGFSAGQSRRFDQYDDWWGANLGADVNEHWSADLRVARSPDAEHLAGATYALDVARRGSGGWAFYLRLQEQQYVEGAVHTTGVAAERYVGAYRIEYAFANAYLDGDEAASHRLSFERYLDSGAAVGLIAAAGQEIEIIGPGQLLRTKTRSLVGTWKHSLGDSLTVGLYAGIYDQGNFYRRTGLGVSLSGAF